VVSDRETALSIINEYRAAYEDDQPVPEDDAGLIERANYLVEQSQVAFESGMRDNTIQMILFLGASPLVDVEPEPARDKPVQETYPRRSSGGLSESDEREVELFNQVTGEKLPVPAPIEGDADPMPRDLTLTSDRDIRKLSGEYNTFLSRVTYLLSVEASDLVGAEHLLNAAKNAALRGINAIGPDKKAKLAKVIDAEIALDPEVMKWSDAVTKHEKQIALLKGLKEIYSGNVSVLSREWTMRQNEWEKSR
jgi:hypothetical protein